MKKIFVIIIALLSVISSASIITLIYRKANQEKIPDEQVIQIGNCCDLIVDFNELNINDYTLNIDGQGVKNSIRSGNTMCFGLNVGEYIISYRNKHNNVIVSGKVNITESDIDQVRILNLRENCSAYLINLSTDTDYYISIETDKCYGRKGDNGFFFYEPGLYVVNITGKLIQQLSEEIYITEEDMIFPCESSNFYDNNNLVTLNLNVIEIGKKINVYISGNINEQTIPSFENIAFEISTENGMVIDTIQESVYSRKYYLKYGLYLLRATRQGNYFPIERTISVSSNMETFDFSFNEWLLEFVRVNIDLGLVYNEYATIVLASNYESYTVNYDSGYYALVNNNQKIFCRVFYPGYVHEISSLDLTHNTSESVNMIFNLKKRISAVQIKICSSTDYSYSDVNIEFSYGDNRGQILSSKEGSSVSGGNIDYKEWSFIPGTYDFILSREGYQDICLRFSYSDSGFNSASLGGNGNVDIKNKLTQTEWPNIEEIQDPINTYTNYYVISVYDTDWVSN